MHYAHTTSHLHQQPADADPEINKPGAYVKYIRAERRMSIC